MPTIEILGDIYEFRRVTRKEIRDIEALANEDVLAFEDAIVVACATRFPPTFPGWDDCLAGIPSTLCKAILEESGYVDDNTLFQTSALDWSETSEARLDILIGFCYPSVSLEDMDNMDPLLYCKYAVATRLIIQNIYGYDPSEFLNPGVELPPKIPQQNNRPQSYIPGR